MPRTRENVYAYRYSSKYFILNLGLSRFWLIFIPERDNKFQKNLAFTMVFFTALSIGCRETFYGNCHLSIKHERAIILLMLTPTHYWSVFQKLKTTVAEWCYELCHQGGSLCWFSCFFCVYSSCWSTTIQEICSQTKLPPTMRVRVT